MVTNFKEIVLFTFLLIIMTQQCLSQVNYRTGHLNGAVKQITRTSYEVDTLKSDWAKGKIKQSRTRSIIYYDENGNCTKVEQSDSEFSHSGRTVFELIKKDFGYEHRTLVYNKDSVLYRFQIYKYDFDENPIRRDSYYGKVGHEWSQYWKDKTEWYVVKDRDTTGHGIRIYDGNQIVSSRFETLSDGTVSVTEYEYNSDGLWIRRKMDSPGKSQETIREFLEYDEFNNWTLMGLITRTLKDDGSTTVERTLTTREYIYY